MLWNKKKDKKDKSIPGMFRIELLYKNDFELDLIDIIKKIEPLTGQIDIVSNTQEMIGVAFTEYTMDWGEGKHIPIQMLFINAEDKFEYSKYQNEVKQSWDWSDINTILPCCSKRLVITDFMARGLENQRKIDLFNKVISVFIEETRCDALYMPLSMCFRNPKVFIDYKNNGGVNYGFFNIRFYTIENTNGEMIMDSIGLYDFMLPDVQCHFRKLNPPEVAKALYNIANYIMENGDIIENGNTVQGISENDKWYCQHENSILEPKRIVIDINPGKEYAAGKRKES